MPSFGPASKQRNSDTKTSQDEKSNHAPMIATVQYITTSFYLFTPKEPTAFNDLKFRGDHVHSLQHGSCVEKSRDERAVLISPRNSTPVAHEDEDHRRSRGKFHTEIRRGLHGYGFGQVLDLTCPTKDARHREVGTGVEPVNLVREPEQIQRKKQAT